MAWDWLERVGSGIMRVGRGVGGAVGGAAHTAWNQATGHGGHGFMGRLERIAATEADPLAPLAIGQAALDGWQQGFGGGPDTTFQAGHAAIGQAAANARPTAPARGSVSGMGFVGRRSDLGPTPRTPGSRPQQGFPGDGVVPSAPGRQPGWQMVPSGHGHGTAQTNAANTAVSQAASNTQGAGSTAEWLGPDGVQSRPHRGGSAVHVGGVRAAQGLMNQTLGSAVDLILANAAIRNRGGTTVEQ